MIERIIEYSVRNRWLIIVVWFGIAVWGLYAVLHTPVDAIPDLSENQVIVFADWMGRSPQDIEEQVTHPLSVQLQGLAGVKSVRSSSEPNFSMINIIFDDKTDFYFARTRVLERLGTAATQLPAGVTPMMAPDATALGQIFWYVVEGDGRSLDELRAIQDFTVRYALNSVPGVAEVAGVGGFVREYQVDVSPAKLRAFDLPLSAISAAIAASNMSVGGKVIAVNNTEYLLRGVGWLRGLKDLEDVVVTSRQGVPIRLQDVATVQLGPEFRRSALEKDGQEAVGGVVMMRVGQNPLEVTQAIKEKIRSLQSGLPSGVRIVPFYDRTRLIESAIHTVTGTLREEIIIASIAILLILAHIRSAIVVCITLPMAVLVSFLFMHYLNIPSNIMSLSGIAISIGILVDAAVVMVENATHELKQHFGDEPVSGDTTEIIIRSCRLVGRPIFFSVVIMLLSFLPIFTFGGQEGKLAHPLAFTKSFAMIGVAVMAITFVPAIIPLFIRGRLKSEEDNWIVRSFIHIYRPVLSWVIDRPGFVWWLMAIILALGSAFIGSSMVSLIVLALGLLAIILGVHKDGWTFWLLAGLLLFALLAVALRGDAYEHLAFGLKRAIPWIVVGIVLFLIVLSMRFAHWRTAALASFLTISFLADTRFRKLGGEFMPSLDEGSIMDMPITAPRIAMSQAVDDITIRDRVLRSFPEVGQAVGKIGRADTATDPSPVDMVETIASLHRPELWPKRKILFADALKEAGIIAAEMQRRGWIKAERINNDEWPLVVQAVDDAEILKRSPRLTDATALLNTATQVAVEAFDRAMRDLARRRQIEYQPEIANQLIDLGITSLVEHLRSLPARDSRPALLREPGTEDRAKIEAMAAKSGVLMANLPRQEEADRLLATIRNEFISRGIAADRDDLLLDFPGLARKALDFARQAAGAEVPGFAERFFAEIESRRETLWQERTRTLNWELFDYGKLMIADGLIDALHRTSLGTPLAGTEPDPKSLADARGKLAADLGRSLLLWQKSKDDLVKEMDSELQMPGWGNVWTQPIINRVNMLATGVRTQIGVKVFGPAGKPISGADGAMADIQRVSEEIARKLKTVRGAVDVTADQALGKRYIEISIDRTKAARYGVNMAELSEAVETALGGSKVTMTVEGRQRFPVRLRYSQDNWQDIEAVRNVLVTGRSTPVELLRPDSSAGSAPSSGGGGAMNGIASKSLGLKAVNPPSSGLVQIPLRMVADVQIVEGPSMIKSENGRLRNYVTLNVRDRDVVGFVDEARQAVRDIEKQMAGSGMSLEWTGEFENQLRARQTLAMIFPLVIALILVLLYVTFKDALDTILVFMAVIGALAGAVMFQSFFKFNFSVIVSIGYVAAFGMATQTGVIMLVYLREALERRGGLSGIGSIADLRRAVIEGAVHRLRPKLLTEGVAIVGLVPMLWATGTGAEIMRPMAAPVLGGLLISDEVIDLMIPVLFYWIRKRRWEKLHGEKPAEVPAIRETPSKMISAELTAKT